MSYFQGIFFLALYNYESLTYQNGTYVYPWWAHVIGWSVVGITLSCIPAFGIFNIFRAECETFTQVTI